MPRTNEELQALVHDLRREYQALGVVLLIVAGDEGADEVATHCVADVDMAYTTLLLGTMAALFGEWARTMLERFNQLASRRTVVEADQRFTH